jgi:hypothetical protein
VSLVELATQGPFQLVSRGVDAMAHDIHQAAERQGRHIRRLARAYGPQSAIEAAETKSGIVMPGDDLQAQLARATDSKWWRRNLTREIGWRREPVYTQIAPTKIDIVTQQALDAYRTSVRRRTNFLRRQFVAPTDGGDPLALDDLTKDRDRTRYAELMARATAIAKISAQDGLEPRFVTITTPSRMHPTTTAGGNGQRRNRRYDQTSPKAAHRWFQRGWKLLRSALNHRNIDFPFVLTAQPNTDSCPHYHLVAWAVPDDWPTVEQLLRKHFWYCEPDDQAAPDQRVRIDTVEDDPESEPSGVMEKIGYAVRMLRDHAEGSVGERNVAWAKLHGIRLFRTSRTHATLRRFCRRRDLDLSSLGPEASAAQASVRQGDDVAFLRHAETAGLKLTYAYAENAYGEMVKRPYGVTAAGKSTAPERRWHKAENPLNPPLRTVMHEVSRGDAFGSADELKASNGDIQETHPPTGPPTNA